MKRITAMFLLAVAGLLAVQTEAKAHAFLEEATPTVGGEVTRPPHEVRLVFNEKINPALSELKIFNLKGLQVDNRDCHCTELKSTSLTVGLPPLPAGKYKVVWKVVSKDSHLSKGDFTFRIVTR
jgi:methionine-rich copper-binding protein CopC